MCITYDCMKYLHTILIVAFISLAVLCAPTMHAASMADHHFATDSTTSIDCCFDHDVDENAMLSVVLVNLELLPVGNIMSGEGELVDNNLHHFAGLSVEPSALKNFSSLLTGSTIKLE